MESSRPPKPAVKSKPQIQDESIMGTNNSSIVSKRSVERLYFPDEPHYFRFFVKKPQRRAPLINRGYWLRMRAVDHTVRQFLETPTKKQKVVVNLGCGYDPLPWQCLSRYPASCSGVKFVDVDYKELMLKKRDVVLNTPELMSILLNVNVEQSSIDILLRSDQYYQVGCDLRNLARLNEVLADVIDIDSQVLFTAEVSITYMNLEDADALIKWAKSFQDARFCLLEQLMPDGSDHPFAQTMMAHFNKLRTPLGSVHKYPTKYAQERRFKSLGWGNVSIRNLWEFWSSPDFLTSRDRCSLDDVEPFDEWEEFALFGCHYFLLVADNTGNESEIASSPVRMSNLTPVFATKTKYSENPKSQGLRRFAAALPVRVSGLLVDGVGNFGGMGLNARVASHDIYLPVPNQAGNLPASISATNSSPSSRMCHTISDLGEIGALLVGGRTSPDNALADCWLWHKWVRVWERIDDLPQARYRHSALDLGGCVLVSSGRTNSRDIGGNFLIWSRHLGWRVCTKRGDEHPPETYGGIFTLFDTPGSLTARSGILTGGISKHGFIEQDFWEWNVDAYTSQEPTISFRRLLPSLFGDTRAATIARFGAATINHGGRTYIVGGVVKDDILGHSDEVCSFAAPKQQHGLLLTPLVDPLKPRPLLVGSTVVSRDNLLLVFGGSAVCFSFGTFLNKGCFSIDTAIEANRSQASSEVHKPFSQWQYWGTSESVNIERAPTTSSSGSLASVPRVKVQSRKEFDKLLQTSKPVIIEGLDLGSCTEKWTTDYLRERIGAEREVVIHEAKSEHMDFQVKNFSYVPTTFEDFIKRADTGAQLYLRSLSSENSSQIPAHINRDFPLIADDFKLPRELTTILESVHSAPLRISGPVIMWLHYDVMANVLCQIRGEKRLLLFPPSEIIHFGFEPGSSSSRINVFDELQKNELNYTQTHDARLLPGDVLFLPPLWLHTALPTSPGISVAVNIFFRSLAREKYAAGKDVYGNRDLQAYEKGRQDIAKIIKSFETLPKDVADFYLGRLARELAACRT